MRKINSNIADRIKVKRGALRLSQTELASRVNISQSSINQYEKGVKTPSVPILRKIALSLDTSVDYLLGSAAKDEIFINQDVVSTFNKFKELSKEDKETVSALINILKNRSHKNR
jgi:transcriptional regulator with XRE-family HTH domain